jgi:hypothetical protein
MLIVDVLARGIPIDLREEVNTIAGERWKRLSTQQQFEYELQAERFN